MGFLKKVNTLILGLAVLLAVGCGGDEPEPDKTATTTEKCRLTRWANPVYYHDFLYDNSGKLIRIDKSMPANPSWHKFQTIEYNASGKISKVHYFESSPTIPVSTIKFDYNAAGLLSQRSYESIGQFSGYVFEKFEYNAAGQLAKKEEFNPTGLYSFSLYSALPGNKIKEEQFLINNGVTYGGGFNEWSFSTQKHPLGSFGYIDNEIYFYGQMSENEITGYAPNGQVSQGYVNSYQYDTNGYTIKEFSVASSGQSVENTYTYSCQ